ncbi:shikimate kinase [Fulvivirgaceae bacterium BMA12]|uniref:Shikimate kinase n=1 Tax=Agaribacillus aureus TaxID=3051825 RepID=A0ABT8L4E2_9BACT|nr:shikimate kinase [Fulvivirgaceae bacterium BMA12]
MKIFLIGMPGSGKSSLGKQLAESLELPFIDLDDIIIKNEELNIPEIFSKFGEDYFRIKERKALHGVNQIFQEFVMATGGGAPCFFDNMAYINENGISIFIDVAPHIIAKRMTASEIEERPLFSNVKHHELAEELDNKLKVRRAYYEQAQHTLQGNNIEVDDLLNLIKNSDI